MVILGSREKRVLSSLRIIADGWYARSSKEQLSKMPRETGMFCVVLCGYPSSVRSCVALTQSGLAPRQGAGHDPRVDRRIESQGCWANAGAESLQMYTPACPGALPSSGGVVPLPLAQRASCDADGLQRRQSGPTGSEFEKV